MRISRSFLNVAGAILLAILFQSAMSPAATDQAVLPQAEGRYRLVVTVVSADRNEAIAGAKVSAVFHYSSNESETALKQTEKTGDDGKAYLVYDFTGNRWEPYHRLDVTISHPDFVETYRNVPITKNRPSGDIAIPVSLKRRSGAKVVTAKVIAADDRKPIVGAHIALRGTRQLASGMTSTAMYDASTDGDGKAVINVTEGDDYSVTVSASTFFSAETTLTVKILDDEQKTYHLDFEMRRIGTQGSPTPTPSPEEEAAETVTPSPTPSPSPTATSKASDEAVVPDLSAFQSVTEMKAVLAHAGLVAAVVAAKEKAPSKEKEFKFAGQDPAPDTKVKRGSTVSIAFYQKFEGSQPAASDADDIVGHWAGTMTWGKSKDPVAFDIQRQGSGYVLINKAENKPVPATYSGGKLSAVSKSSVKSAGLTQAATVHIELTREGETLSGTLVLEAANGERGQPVQLLLTRQSK